MKDIEVVRNGVSITEQELCTPLISVSPIAKASGDEDHEEDEAAEFDSVTHVRQRRYFSYLRDQVS